MPSLRPASRPSLALAACAALGVPLLLSASGLVTFNTGEVASATDVNANFSDLDGRLATLEAAASPRAKLQTKTLSSDITSDSDAAGAAQISFANLTVGKAYRLEPHVMLNAPGGGDLVQVSWSNGATQVFRAFNQQADAETVFIHASTTFVATDTTLTAIPFSTSASGYLRGNGTVGQTYVTLMEFEADEVTTF